MLPSKNRIDKKLFDEIFKKGKTTNSKFFVLKNYQIKDGKRFSFIVPPSVSKNAVKRNLLKRRGKYIINTNKDKIIDNNAFIFIFKKNVLEKKFFEIKEDLISLLKNFLR